MIYISNLLLNLSILRKGEDKMSKKIVILGAGYAGVHAAKKLAKKYKKNHFVYTNNVQ